MGFQLSSKQNNLKFYNKVNLFSYFKTIWTTLTHLDIYKSILRFRYILFYVCVILS
jgi:flagellar biosynthesis protein FlhB